MSPRTQVCPSLVEVSLGPGALGDGGVDLLNTLRLLAGGSSDFRNKRVGRAHLLGDLRERLLDLGGALSGLPRWLQGSYWTGGIAALILS